MSTGLDVTQRGWLPLIRKSGSWLAVIAITAGLLIGSVAYLQSLKQPLPETASPVSRRDVEVSAWGRLAPQSDVIPLSAAANQVVACVQELLVTEGDEVVKGARIAILDTYDRRVKSVEEMKARLASAKARLQAVSAGAKPEEIAVQKSLIEFSQVELQDAQTQVDRGLELSKTNAISREDMDTRYARLRKATASLAQARSQLASMQNPRREDIVVAEAEVQLAEATLAVAMADLEQCVLRSPVNGRILQVHARPGQKISEEGVVDIGDTSIMHAIAEVYEEDIGRLAEGQSARIEVPSIEKTFVGHVVRVNWIVARKSVFSNDPVEDTDARVIEVRIALNKEDSLAVARFSNARIHARIDAPAPIRSTPTSTVQTTP